MVKGMDAFSDSSDTTLFERVNAAWEFVEGFPLPKWELTCECGSNDLKVCSFSYGKKDDNHISQRGGVKYACTTIYRCRQCTEFHVFDMAVSEETFQKRSPEGQAILYHWEKALAIIQKARSL